MAEVKGEQPVVKKTREELLAEIASIDVDAAAKEAVSEEDDDSGETEEGFEEEPEDSESETEDELPEEGTTEESAEDDSNPTGKQVPLVKYVEEKKKRQAQEAEIQALKLQLQEMQGDTQAREIEEYKTKTKEKYIKLGYDEDLATALADDLTETYSIAKKAQVQAPVNTVDRYAVEILKLKTESDYYDNAESFSDKIKSTMQAAEKAGMPITAKQAYNMVVDPDVRRKELTQRSRAAAGAQGKPASTTVPTSGGSKSKPDSTILKSKADQEALKYLQQNFPNMNWTAKMYKEHKT